MTIAVTSLAPSKTASAQQMAAAFNLTWLDAPDFHDQTYSYYLVATPDYWGLQSSKEKRFAPFYIDFLSGKMLHRSEQAGLRKELLGRAMGCHPRDNPSIIDTTAGLGRDSFILARLGFTITALERSPILYLLLNDALQRAKQNLRLAPIIERIHLIHTDATTWLTQHKADIIYLDPMFPERQKSASVKKEMVILQELLGKDEDADVLFNLALTCATRRVVVKRPRLAAAIDARSANFSLPGKSSRFDVYLTNLRVTD